MTTARAERPATYRADLALLGITAIWGFTFPAMQRGLQDMSPLVLLTARFTLAAVAMLLIFRRSVLNLSNAGLSYSMLLGVCLAAGSILQTIGLNYTSASKSAFITSLYMVIIPIFVVIIERVRPRLSSILAVVLAMIGLFLLTNPNQGVNRGDWLTLGCAFAFAFHIIIADIVSPRYDPVALSFGQILVSAIIFGTMLGITGDMKFTPTPWAISTILVTGLLATVLGYTVQLWGQRESSATHVAIIFAAEPVFAGLFTRFMQHEILAGSALIGGILIIGAILVSQIGAHKN